MKDNDDSDDFLSNNTLDSGLDLDVTPADNKMSETSSSDFINNVTESPISPFKAEPLSDGPAAENTNSHGFQKIIPFPVVSLNKKSSAKTHSKRDLAIHAYCFQKKNY